MVQRVITIKSNKCIKYKQRLTINMCVEIIGNAQSFCVVVLFIYVFVFIGDIHAPIFKAHCAMYNDSKDQNLNLANQ